MHYDGLHCAQVKGPAGQSKRLALEQRGPGVCAVEMAGIDIAAPDLRLGFDYLLK